MPAASVLNAERKSRKNSAAHHGDFRHNEQLTLQAYQISGMRHRLFSITCIISVMLCMATLASWVRSYRAYDAYSYPHGGWTRKIGASRGKLVFLDETGHSLIPGWRSTPPVSIRARQPMAGEPGVKHHGSVLGAFWYVTEGGNASPTVPLLMMPNGGLIRFTQFAPSREVIIPLWFFAAIFAILPAFWFAGFFIRRVRSRRGCCVACGYSLTGNTSGTCPECGTRIEPGV